MFPREGGGPSPAGASWNRPEMGPRLRGDTPLTRAEKRGSRPIDDPPRRPRPHPRSAARRGHRARQFRRLSRRASGRRRPRRAPCPRRGAPRDRCDLRPASGALLQTRCPALSLDHARPAAGIVRRRRRRCDARPALRRRARGDHGGGFHHRPAAGTLRRRRGRHRQRLCVRQGPRRRCRDAGGPRPPPWLLHRNGRAGRGRGGDLVEPHPRGVAGG